MLDRGDFFPDLDVRAYLAHAAISPLNRRAVDAISHLAKEQAIGGMKAWPAGIAVRDRCRSGLAALIGTVPERIALMPNTSQGLWISAHEFPWESGDRLVLFEGEFPGNVVPWLAAAKHFDLEIIWLTLDDLAQQNMAFKAAMERRPRLLAVSWVQYQTGRVTDLALLSDIRGRYGVAVCLDAIQGVGALVMNLQKTPLDMVACGGHKWLLSPEGTGFLYLSQEMVARARGSFSGWLSQREPFDFLFGGAGLVDYQKPLRGETDRYEIGTMASLPFAGMAESVDLFLEQGMDQVSKRVRQLADQCREGMGALGFKTFDQNANAGIASMPMNAEPLARWHKQFTDWGVLASTPDGYLRAAPHFTTGDSEILLFLEALAELAATEPPETVQPPNRV